MDSEADPGPGYMLVPWSSWDQWNFVRESLFSPSHDSVTAALRRITAWKSRGCLPVAVEVTARIVEIQHMDPFFFGKEVASQTMNSEDMLALLYSITLTRLVNGFTEKVSYFDDHAQKHGKKKHSISNLADAIGLPRMVVDIRHESSHNDVPSLPLVRLASIRALDWLKSHYWEPQSRAIPDVRKQIRMRLHQMSNSMKAKQADNKNRSQIKERGPSTQLSKISKTIAELYSVYPYEVASVLLEALQSQGSALSDSIAVDCNSLSSPDPRVRCITESKDIIRKLSRKRPGLLLTMLKEVLGIIEAEEPHVTQEETSQVELLSPLVQWLSSTLKDLSSSGHVSLSDEQWAFSSGQKSIPKTSVKELLRKCLVLSSSGNKHLLDSSVLLAEMVADGLVVKRVKELPSLAGLQKFKARPDNCSSSSPDTEIFFEEESIRQASAKIDLLKSKRKTGGDGPAKADAETKKRRSWAVAERWTPCPIGTLPCPLSSTYSVPVLDGPAVGPPATVAAAATVGDREAVGLPHCPPSAEKLEAKENGAMEGVRERATSPTEGLLLIDGVWRAVGKEELLAVQSAVRIMV
ncbi:unnamed protein product [Spirodela intermedia]|uniref:Uncharacterized protein n=1 Tax=Spirodela intermedia TaxID=51605 RepID=A0A7I8I9R4_SPIIN|nr:unnamed protein product [Spirodela intermedia]CAA6654447.1 unnamed protein product [Spirodela intermedia]